MFLYKAKFLEPSLTMSVDNNSYQSSFDADKNYRPVLRSRTQTFVNLSSKYTSLPAMPSYSTSSFVSPSSTIFKREDASGRVTTAYAIRVTAVNNHKDGLLRTENTHVMNNIKNNVASVRVVNIKKPVVDKPLPLAPVSTPVNASAQMHDDKRGPRVKSILRESSSSKMPLPGIVEQAGKLDVLDMQGNQVPFRDLYLPSSDLTEKTTQEKTMVIFVRPSFCTRVSLFPSGLVSVLELITNSYVEHSSRLFCHR
jgi:hypothetical protein